MNQTRVAIAVVLSLLIVGGWISLLGGKAGETSQLSELLEQAQIEEARGLYEKAILSYEQVLSQSPKLERYEDLNRVYCAYYAKSHSSTVRRNYDNLLNRACAAFPKETQFWETHVQLYMEQSDYSKAVRLLQRAKERGISSEYLEHAYQDAYYQFRVGYKTYPQIRPGCWSGCYVMQDSNGLWGLQTMDGSEMLTSIYAMMGPCSVAGTMAITDGDGVSWLIDSNGMLLVRYDETIEDAGCWSEGLVPVKTKGSDTWSYMEDSGAESLSGYLTAGSFYGGETAVQTAAGWQIINENGETVSDAVWDEIRLDQTGAFVQNGCILAKDSSGWGIYDASWKEQGEFRCDEIDIHVDGPIAFCRDGVWGFVSEKGQEVISPAYDQAHSFSNGVAAVCRNGLWGFIDGEGRQVLDFQFTQAGYFAPNGGGCPVQRAKDGAFEIICWVVAR